MGSTKISMNEAAQETIPATKRCGKRKWMTTDILKLMEERRKAKGNEIEYSKLCKEVKRQCDCAKEKWLGEQCQEIEEYHLSRNPKAMYQKVKELSGKKGTNTNGCIKSKDGSVLMEKQEQLERWAEYIRDLYGDDTRAQDYTLKKTEEGPPILTEEVKKAINLTRQGKSTGPDNISIEELIALEDFGIKELTSIINEIYHTGIIPTDLLKSIFVALPKKPRAVECENHRTISLMSHVTKILLRIVMMRIRNKIKPEIAAEQSGFVEGKGTANGIFMLRTLIERALETQNDLYLCFIDYTKAFDRVKHQEIIKILESLNVDANDLTIIKNMYWQQSAAVRIENDYSNFQPIKRGSDKVVSFPQICSLYTANTSCATLREFPVSKLVAA